VRYKCFCETNPYDLTKEEIRFMLRKSNRYQPEEFVKHYNIDGDTFKKIIKIKGLVLTRVERSMLREMSKADEEGFTSTKNGMPYDPLNVDEIPKVLICALYGVDFEIVNGKRHYDVEQFERAKEDVGNKIEKYERIMKGPEKTQGYSKLSRLDLIAMRIFRGYNRQKLSKETALTINMIKEYESKGSKIPLYVENTYKEVLGIKNRHIIQLREIMSGQSKSITDDREIPKIIKLKVWKRDKGKCVKCAARDKLHYHHIKRFAEGGQHTEENLMLLCAGCHAEEHKGEKAYYMLKKMAEG